MSYFYVVSVLPRTVQLTPPEHFGNLVFCAPVQYVKDTREETPCIVADEVIVDPHIPANTTSVLANADINLPDRVLYDLAHENTGYCCACKGIFMLVAMYISGHT